MLDLIGEFEKHEKKIGAYISKRVSAYFSHETTKQLVTRVRDLYSSQMLMPTGNKYNQWISNVTFPVVLQRALLRRAILKANYKADDLYALTPSADTPYEFAANAELVLNCNLKAPHVRFKQDALYPALNFCARFGTAVMYTYWKRASDTVKKTVFNPNTGTYERAAVASRYENAYSAHVDIRDYFQNPEVVDSAKSDFQGHIRRVHVSELVGMLNDDSYIRENVQKVLEKCKNGRSVDGMKLRDDSQTDDKKSWGVEIARYEGQIAIEGNEESEQTYFVEIIGDIIIKLSIDDYDEDIRSYTVLNMDRRIDTWYGSADCEYIVSHENYLNAILGMTLDNAMRAMNQYVFYDKQRINPADINNRIRNQGFIGVDARDIPLSNLVLGFQPGRIDMAQTQYAVNVVQQSVQELSTKVDLSRKPTEGGLNNKTATAANIVAGQSDVLEADLLDNFDVGMCELGYKTLVMLRQFMPMQFSVRPSPKDADKQLEKLQMLGDVAVGLNTTLEKAKAGEVMRLQNLASWWGNAAANPAFQGVALNLAPLVKDILSKSDLPVAEIMPPEQVPQGQPGFQPSTAPQGAMTQGMPSPMGAM